MGNDTLKLAILGLQFVALAFRLFTIVQLWTWFAVDDLGLPPIQWFHAFMIIVANGVIAGFEVTVNDETTSEELWAKRGGVTVAYIVGCIFALLTGLLLKGVS